MNQEQENYILNINKKSELETTISYILRSYQVRRDTYRLFFLVLLFFFFSRFCNSICTLLVVSYVTAFILNPLVSCLSKYISRGTSFLLICIVVFVFFISFFVFLIPSILSDYAKLLEEIPVLVRNIYTYVTRSSLFIRYFGADVDYSSQVVETMRNVVSYANIRLFLDKIFDSISGGYGYAMAALNFALYPLLVFYISKDWSYINNVLLRAFPDSYESTVHSFAMEIESVTNTFIKGQVLIALILSILYSIALLIVGLPYAIPIGFFSGILGVIPYAGLIFGLVLSMLVQGTYDPTISGFLYIALAFIIVQFIEGNFITPKIVGDAMGLHPLLVIVALLIGAELMGFSGLLFAIPVATLLKTEFSRRILSPD